MISTKIRKINFKKQNNIYGVSLIEVLVSIVVLSLGLLGIAGLQSSVTKYKINTWARSAIAILYSDFADRVRMNSDVAGVNFITGTGDTSQYLLSDTWATQNAAILSTPSPNCDSAACTPTQRAAYDMSIWRQRVKTALPQGGAIITGDKLNGITVTFMWYDKELTDKGGASDSVLVSSATCAGTETGLAQQTCCPAVASIPVGVRCARFSFVP